MEVENSVNMSLDDIISQNKKSRPVGNKKTKSPQGIPVNSRKNAPLVRTGRQSGKGGARPQSSQNGKTKTKQALAPKRTAMHAVSKRQPQNRPGNQSNRNQPRSAGKTKQQNAPKFMPKAGNRAAPQRTAPTALVSAPTLRVTIENPKALRQVPSNQQSRPQINMPGRQQFVVANPAARQNSMVRTQSPPYAPAAQPMDILEAEVNYPAATSRRSYANTAARPVNAASFLRDPYRGDDFERTSSQGMRSDYGRYDGQGHRKPGGFGDLMDDRYNPATSSAAYARPGSRSQRV